MTTIRRGPWRLWRGRKAGECAGKSPLYEVRESEDEGERDGEEGEPGEEGWSLVEGDELREGVGLFGHCAKDADEGGTGCDQGGTECELEGKGVAQEEVGKEGVADEADGAEGSEDDEGEGRDLEQGAGDVGEEKDGEADEPEGPLPVGGTALLVREVAQALEGQAEGLDEAGGDSDEDSDCDGDWHRRTRAGASVGLRRRVAGSESMSVVGARVRVGVNAGEQDEHSSVEVRNPSWMAQQQQHPTARRARGQESSRSRGSTSNPVATLSLSLSCCDLIATRWTSAVTEKHGNDHCCDCRPRRDGRSRRRLVPKDRPQQPCSHARQL